MCQEREMGGGELYLSEGVVPGNELCESSDNLTCPRARVTRRPDFGRTVRFSSLLSGPRLRVRLFALFSSFLILPAQRRNLKLARASISAN